MDKQILNAIAEVLKEERERFSSEIDQVANAIPNYEEELEKIGKAIDDFSFFAAAEREHDSRLAAELEEIHKKIGGKLDADSSFFDDLKTWADDFELRKEFDHIQFQEDFAEIKEIALSVKDGERGEDGKHGKDGVDGRDGMDNPAIAPISIDRDFKASKGLVVYHRGGLWQAIRNTNGDPEADSGNWNCFVDGISDVTSSFDAQSALHYVHFEKTNGTKETVSFERPPAYLPAGEHKSVDGDFFLDETSLNVYVQGTWLAKDLKGERGDDGKDGTRGRVGKRGVGIEDIIAVENGWTVLLTNGETKDLYLDILNNGKEDVDQEIKRYAGNWHSSKSYSVGDVVTLTNSLFVCLSNTSDSPESSDSWAQMVSPASGGTFLSSDGGSGSGGGGPLPDFVLVAESGTGGTKLSSFKESSSVAIQFIGVDENKKDVKATLTTDMIKVNPLPFRNSRNGQFIGTPEELDAIENQRDYNEFVFKALSEIEAGEIDLDGYLQKLTQDEKIEIIEAQIQYRGLMELDADNKPLWPANQTKPRGGWWAYPTAKTSGWNFNKLQWIFPHYGEVSEDGSTLTNNVTKGYQVGDIIQLQISYNEAGAGNGYKYADVQPVYVEYRIDELHYPDRLNGNSNNDYPAYKVSMSGPAHRYTGRMPNEIKGPQGDPSDAWIQWYPTAFAYGAALGDYASNNDIESIEGRVEDIEAALPAADAVAAVPTGDLELKITGSRPTGATGEAGKMLMWKAEAGSGGNPYNEIKFPVSDVDAINLEANQVWFKQGDVVQKWTCGDGWFTNNNVLHISATAAEGDTLIDGQPIEMYYADPSAVYAPVISVAESKADDRRLQVEIEQLALGLETLLTQRAVGEWRYEGSIESGPPRDAGTFKALADMSAVENRTQNLKVRLSSYQ